MRKVILTIGLIVGLAAWVVGIVGLATTSNAYVIPVPDRFTVFGVFAMMGTLTIFVIVFAHGTAAGSED